MSQYQSFAYECSRNNASIVLDEDGTSWINEFQEGIELEPGDQVRILGSFVNESATGSNIEVDTDNNSTNILFSPYIKGTTFSTSDTSDDLMTLGDYATPCYSTDGFGIEPPSQIKYQHITDPGTGTSDGSDGVYKMALTSAGTTPTFYNNQTEGVYQDKRAPAIIEDPYADSTANGLESNGNSASQWISQGNVASTWGSNIITGGGLVGTSGGPNTSTKQLTPDQAYQAFSKLHISNDFYISTLCKKLILPIFTEMKTGHDIDFSTPNSFIFEALNYNPPIDGDGCLSGIPKPGYMICTINIGDTNGWYDETGQSWNESRDPLVNNAVAGTQQRTAAPNFGKINLKGGPQSVVGKVLAVRPVRYHTPDTMNDFVGDPTTIPFNAFEVFVYDFFNPAQHNKIIEYDGEVGKFIKGNTYRQSHDDQKNTTTLKLRKQVHGGTEFFDGYSYNPSINHINGYQNTPQSAGVTFDGAANDQECGVDGMPGQMAMMPSYFTHGETLVYPGPDGQNNCSNLQDKFIEGSDNKSPSQYDLGFGKSMGLSFLWSGSDCGFLNYNGNIDARYGIGADATPANNGVGGAGLGDIGYSYHQYKANTIQEMGLDGGGNLVHTLRVINSAPSQATDVGQDGTLPPLISNTFWNVGAMICCREETMKLLINGTITEPTYGATAPRVWFPWTCQLNESQYNERHMKDNSRVTDNTLQLFQFNPATNNPEIAENRFGVGFIGQPLNQNWRSQFKPGRRCGANAAYTGLTTCESRGDLFMNYGGQTPAAPSPTLPRNREIDPNITVPDFMPRYYSTTNGLRTSNVSAAQAGRPGGLASEAQGSMGGPFKWGGYNNCNTSIHFQTPSTGDVNLNFGASHLELPAIASGAGNTDTLFEGVTMASPNRPQIGDLMTGTSATGQPIFPITNTVLNVVANGATGIRVSSTKANLITFGTGQVIIFNPAGGFSATGVNGVWGSGDCIVIKEHIMKLKVDNGFYTPDLLSDRLNKQLHDNTQDYATELGTFDTTNNKYDVPTSVGLTEKALASVPTVINSNMLQTYIPDISYGFMPVTTDNATRLGQTASTKEITSEILNVDTYDFDTGQLTFYGWHEVPTTETYTDNLRVHRVNKNIPLPVGLNANIGDFKTPCGNHIKLYTIPYLPKLHMTNGDGAQLHIFKLKGGALSSTDFDKDATPPSYNNKISRHVYAEQICEARFARGIVGPYPTALADQNQGVTSLDTGARAWCGAGALWRTRLARNLLSSGGGCRIFVGANNPTISYNQAENRVMLTNLYTPFRPHQSENPGKTDFSVGDAVPSAIINSRQSGAVTDSLCGIYINSLAGPAFTQEAFGTQPFDNPLYDTETDAIIVARGLGLMAKLGFSKQLVEANDNDFTKVSTPYTWIDRTLSFGTAIRNLALVDSAVNATNPAVSNCLFIAPVRQYMVEVDSNEFLADANPELGNDPFYLIGSDFPAKEFYGSSDGSKLPVIGICSRNFSSFNFVFDLGGSSITYTVDSKRTIKSITTKIYTSKMGNPQNLSKYSSIIYLLTKGSYLKQLSPQEAALAEQQQVAEANAKLIGAFYNPSMASVRTEPPPQIPANYYDSSGSYDGVSTDMPSSDIDE